MNLGGSYEALSNGVIHDGLRVKAVWVLGSAYSKDKIKKYQVSGNFEVNKLP